MGDLFGIGSAEVAAWIDPLADAFGRPIGARRRAPLAQMVKSLISARTRDDVSLAAYRRLGARWPRSQDLAHADPADVEAAIADVTFADEKATRLPAALRMIEAERPDMRLDFLADMPVGRALAWLERLPGVGRHVSAKTLNASTLGMRVFIVDTHVARVLARLGFTGAHATTAAASDLVTASAPFFDAEGLLQLYARMKRLGQTICRLGEPDCPACPLSAHCRTGRTRVDLPHSPGDRLGG